MLYAEELLGPNTVDTMPQETIVNFRDHGQSEAQLAWSSPISQKPLPQIGAQVPFAPTSQQSAGQLA